MLRLGLDAFARQAADAGVDGVLALDLPIEEAGAFRETLASAGIDTIFLLTPTTTDARSGTARRWAAGFCTAFAFGSDRRARPGGGWRGSVVRRIRAHTAMRWRSGSGFRAGAGRRGLRLRDAAVVGSALVSLIAEASADADLIDRVERFVQWLKRAGRPDGRPLPV